MYLSHILAVLVELSIKLKADSLGTRVCKLHGHSGAHVLAAHELYKRLLSKRYYTSDRNQMMNGSN